MKKAAWFVVTKTINGVKLYLEKNQHGWTSAGQCAHIFHSHPQAVAEKFAADVEQW